MNKKMIVPALLALAVASGASAFAQDRQRGAGDGGWQQQQRDAAYRHEQRGDDSRDQRGRERQDRTEGNFGRTEDFSAGYDGAGPNHNLRRGEPLPGRYRTHQYVVDNWRAYHLTRPAHGYRWIQAGADYVLVDESTGVIEQVALGR